MDTEVGSSFDVSSISFRGLYMLKERKRETRLSGESERSRDRRRVRGALQRLSTWHQAASEHARNDRILSRVPGVSFTEREVSSRECADAFSESASNLEQYTVKQRVMPRSRTGQGRQANPVAVILPRVE